jgi:hypothetical protein
VLKDLVEILKQFGFSEALLLAILIVGFVFGLVVAVLRAIRWAILKNDQWILNESLKPYFSPTDVDRATRYYIPTRFQNVSPSADDEPGKGHLAAAKQPLMPLFLNESFHRAHADTKYYLILADTGMGKTTFLINLYLRYVSKPINNLISRSSLPKMRLFPLGSPDIWSDINEIEDKRNTILLLDAFDEEVIPGDDYVARMNSIIQATTEFDHVVITCRTQFFPTDREIPDDTGYATFGGEQETYRFQRIYLSVFDERDIKRYLQKRFPLWKPRKRKRSLQLVKKIPDLVMRPLLLTYINDLVEVESAFENTYEIYDVLIDKWVQRESKKRGIRKKYGTESEYAGLLLRFSQDLAVDLYMNRERRGGYFITRDEVISDPRGLQIVDATDYGMSDLEIRSKSLLNRNADGQYKFSHKSILEFFLAKELVSNPAFRLNFDFSGMSFTRKLYREMTSEFRGVAGVAWLDNKETYPLTDLTPDDFHLVRRLKITRLGESSPLSLTAFANLEELTIAGEQSRFLSVLYVGARNYRDEKSPKSPETKEGQATPVQDKVNEPLRVDFIEARRAVQERFQEVQELSTDEWIELKRRLRFIELQGWFGNTYLGVQLLRWAYGRGKLKPVVRAVLGKDFAGLAEEWEGPLFRYVSEVQGLRKALPNCKVWY